MSSDSPPENKRPSIPPPFVELALPTAERYYDLSCADEIMERIPECREHLDTILRVEKDPKKAALVMLNQIGLEGRTEVTEKELIELRRKLQMVCAINACKKRGAGNSYIQAFMYL